MGNIEVRNSSRLFAAVPEARHASDTLVNFVIVFNNSSAVQTHCIENNEIHSSEFNAAIFVNDFWYISWYDFLLVISLLKSDDFALVSRGGRASSGARSEFRMHTWGNCIDFSWFFLGQAREALRCEAVKRCLPDQKKFIFYFSGRKRHESEMTTFTFFISFCMLMCVVYFNSMAKYIYSVILIIEWPRGRRNGRENCVIDSIFVNISIELWQARASCVECGALSIFTFTCLRFYLITSRDNHVSRLEGFCEIGPIASFGKTEFQDNLD